MADMAQAAQEEVRAFWAWFERHSQELAAVEVDPRLLDELAARVSRMGDFDWEIGPGVKQACSFALSPGGDADALAKTREVVGQAPRIAGWELHAAKPPRQWSLEFELDRAGQQLTIDGKEWEVVVYRFKDGSFDILLKPPATSELTQDEADWAARVIVDGELGEAVAMDVVGSVEAVKEWDARAAAAARKLEVGLLARVTGAARH